MKLAAVNLSRLDFDVDKSLAKEVWKISHEWNKSWAFQKDKPEMLLRGGKKQETQMFPLKQDRA
jgi:hypothetical protein